MKNCFGAYLERSFGTINQNHKPSLPKTIETRYFLVSFVKSGFEPQTPILTYYGFEPDLFWFHLENLVFSNSGFELLESGFETGI